jgi:low affinity Fe/Cu permease
MKANGEKNWFEAIGCRVSAYVADVFAHPLAQIGIILFCALWWFFRLPTDILTAALSILAITLTQMVLNNQNEREMDSHRRDVAMHAKLDELIAASRRAKNDFVGIEEREEDEIVQLKEEVKEAIEDEPAEVRDAAKRIVDEAAQDVEQAREKHPGRQSRRQPAKRRRAASR